MASRAVRFIVALCFGFGWCGVFGAPACSKQYSCTSNFSTKNCAEVTDASSCTKLHGCRRRTPTCVNGCDVGIGCGTGDCRTAEGVCTSLCASAHAANDCDDLLSSLGAGGPAVHQCEWSGEGVDGGASCQSVCAPERSEKSCSEQGSAGCAWVVCEGTVKDDCSSYSGDECPTFLGCDRTTDAVE